MELNRVADMEVGKVADMVADNKKKLTATSTLTWKYNLVIELVGWLVGPKLFRPEDL